MILKLNGEAHETTIHAASDYANSLSKLKRHKEAKSLLRKMMPVARRGLGEGHRLTLKMRGFYAQALYTDPATTLDALREAVMTLEDAERIARRVFGGAHPLTTGMEEELQDTRAALHARETPRGDGVEDDDDDEDGWETVSSDDDEEAPTTEAIS